MKIQRVLVVILKDDYGDPKKGPSYEFNYFYQGLRDIFPAVELFDFGPYLHDTVKLQADVIEAADRFQPDLIFFTLYQDQFSFETLEYLKKKYVTMNWFCDDQWRFDDFTSVFAPHFSFVTTTDPFALPKYHRIGYHQVIPTQWATRETAEHFDPATIEYAHDVSFVGGINPYRAWLIQKLGQRGINVEAYGTGWENGRVSYDEMNRVFQTSRINLNIPNSKNYDIRFVLSSWANFQNFRTTQKNRDQVKGRHFEIPAYGGFQLTNYSEFLEDYFILGKEIAVYNTLDDLVEKIHYYLADESRRQSIAKAGYERTRSEHTYAQRFYDIFKRITA